MKNLKIDLNTIKHDMEAKGYKFAEGTFENAMKQFVDKHTDETGAFQGVLGESNREPGRFDTKLINVSHKVTNVNLDDMTADIQILDTPCGKMLQQIIDNDIECRPTLNGSCIVTTNGISEINQIFNIDFTKNKS